MFSAFAIIALTAGTALQDGPTVDARLEAFQAYCLPHRLDPAATLTGFEQAGWSVVTDAAHPELPALLRLDREQAAAADALAETVILRRGALLATVNTTTAEITEEETARYSTCAIWDLDAETGIADDSISAWARVPAQVRLDTPSLGPIVQWNLSVSQPGAGNLQTSSFPESSPAVARTGFTGASIFLTSDLDARP